MSKLAILPVLIALLFLSGCIGDAPASLPPELLLPVSTRVDTAIVTRGSVAAVSRYIGITRTSSEHLSFGSITDRFCQFYVHIGDSVTEGQLLATLNTENIERDMANQLANISRILQENDLNNQRQCLHIRRLVQEGASSHEIESAELLLEQEKERQALRLSHEEEHLAALKTQLEMMEIRAPYDGVITYIVRLEAGEWVGSFRPVIYISTGNNVFVEYMGSILQHPGRAVRVIGYITSNSYSLQHSPLTAAEQLYYQSHLSATPIRFEIDGNIPPPTGAYVSIDVYTQWEEDALRIPSNALFYVAEHGFHVYRIKSGQLELVVLEIGARTETFTEILSGLYEGDEIFVRP